MMKSTPPSSVHTPEPAISPIECCGTMKISTAMSSTANNTACTTSVTSEPRMPPRQQYATVMKVNRMAAMMNGAVPDSP